MSQSVRFKVGDIVTQAYISDRNIHNNMPATVEWIHQTKIYPTGNTAKPNASFQIGLRYINGDTGAVTYTPSEPAFSPLTKI